MGLPERRATKAFVDKRYPELKKQIDEIAGFEVNLEVAWETMAVDDSADLYDEAWTKVYFEPLMEALRGICIDDMGKEALHDGLKKVVIRHSGSNEFSFTDGTLLVDHWPTSNIDSVRDRCDSILKALEKGL